MTTLATLTVRLIGDVEGFRETITGAAQSVQRAGEQMSAAGRTMTTHVTAPIAGIGAAAVLMGNQFNSGMANVISLAPDAAEEIAGMSGAVQDLAVEMGASTSDMTGGLYQVVSAFGLGSDSMDVLRANAMAAAAGLATTTEAINLTSAVTKGYGDTSAEAVQQVADLAMQTVALGQTTFPELAASMGRVAPIASNLGVSQQELFGVMATLTGVTGNAAEVSTQFRGALQSLMAPTEQMQAVITGMGYETAQAAIEQEGFAGVMQAVVAAANASGAPLQSYIGSIEGQTLALALAGPQAGTFAEKLAAMGDVSGRTQAAFDAQTQGVNANGFAMQQAAIQMQVMAQQLGQALQPAVTAIMPMVQQFLGWVQGLVQRFTELDPKTQTIIMAVVGLAAALGPVLMVLGPIVSGIGAVGVVLGALISPVGLVVAAVAALAAAWATDFGGIRTTVTKFWDEHLRPIFETLLTWLRDNIPPALATLAGVWENTLKPAIETVWRFIQDNIFPILQTLVNVYIAAAKTELAALGTVWTTVLKPAIEAVWRFIQDNVIPILQTLLTWLRDNIPPALTALAGFWENTLKPALKTVWEFLQQNVIPILQKLVEVYFAAVGAALRVLAEFWTLTLLPALKTVWQFLGDNVIPVIRLLIETWFARLKTSLETVARLWRETLWPAIRTVWQLVVDNVQPALVGLKAVLDGPLGRALNTVAGLFGRVASAIGDIQGAVQGVLSWLQGLIDKLNSIHVPDILTPGSPTPFELGLRGVSAALEQLVPLIGTMGTAFAGLDADALRDVGQAMGVFGEIIAAVSAIAGYTPVVIGQTAETIVQQMKGLVRKLVRASREIREEMGATALAEAAEAGRLLSDVMRPWKDAIDAVTAIMEFSAARAEKIGPAAERLAGQMMGLARKLARVFRELGPEAMADAAQAGKDLTDALEPWLDAVEVMEGLGTTTPAAVGTAIDAVLGMIQTLGEAGIKTGMSWIDGLTLGIKSALPRLLEMLERVRGYVEGTLRPPTAGGGRLEPLTMPGAGRLEPPTMPGAGRLEPGPVTVNISGPFYIREEGDIERLAAAVAELLGRQAEVYRRVGVW